MKLVTVDNYTVCGHISKEFCDDVVDRAGGAEEEESLVAIKRFANYFIAETQK